LVLVITLHLHSTKGTTDGQKKPSKKWQLTCYFFHGLEFDPHGNEHTENSEQQLCLSLRGLQVDDWAAMPAC
jgi:hypothetical protein